MNLEEFKVEFKNRNNMVTDEQVEKFYNYMDLLLEWNEKINLTAITQPEEVIEKHFSDSLTILDQINN